MKHAANAGFLKKSINFENHSSDYISDDTEIVYRD